MDKDTEAAEAQAYAAKEEADLAALQAERVRLRREKSEVPSLVSNRYAETGTWERAHRGHVETAVSLGANVNEKNQLGRTPLMLACAFASRAEVVAALIEEGADASASSIAGWQPLHFLAANNTSTEAPLMAEALMRAGASAQAPTDQSTLETPIAMANKFNQELVPTLESTDPRGFNRIKLAKSVKTLFGVDAFKAAEHQPSP